MTRPSFRLGPGNIRVRGKVWGLEKLSASSLIQYRTDALRELAEAEAAGDRPRMADMRNRIQELQRLIARAGDGN